VLQNLLTNHFVSSALVGVIKNKNFFFIPLAPFAFAIPSAQGELDSFLKNVFSTKIIFFKCTRHCGNWAREKALTIIRNLLL
jgi:hypothetical protein